MRPKPLPPEHPANQLNHKVAQNLTEALGLKKVDELTPKYLSNITASQLMKAKVTLVAISAAQEWLLNNGTSLKRKPPSGKDEMQAVKRAINILDTFYLDTSKIRAQLDGLLIEED